MGRAWDSGVVNESTVNDMRAIVFVRRISFVIGVDKRIFVRVMDHTGVNMFGRVFVVGAYQIIYAANDIRIATFERRRESYQARAGVGLMLYDSFGILNFIYGDVVTITGQNRVAHF